MARYRKVEVKTWNDEKFKRLSPIKPSGQGLWVWLLTGTRTTNIPGIVIGTDLVMAAELRWPLEAFREAFDEVFREGMAKACWEAGLVWLPNASKVARGGESRNKPESPNVVRSWRDTWDEIPECALKVEVWRHLKAFTEAFGEGFGKAFGEACERPSLKAMANQEQEQEQEQNKTGHEALPKAFRKASAKDSEGNTPAAIAPALDPDCDPRNHPAWLGCRAAYPSHVHGDHHWLVAERDASQRVEEGERWSTIKAGCERLCAQQTALGNIGTQFVPAPSGMFTRREKRYLEPFPLPKSKGEVTQDENIDAARAFLALEGGEDAA